mgnify:CR=1 FL=1|jgi:hypothetical protein|tara:strand:+ start:2155 stop:2985 length:831 start_codon:yes stop_codon:yes gene_type:complete
MSRAIVTLIQQSNRILDTVAPKVKEEANKKISEVKQKIPTKESVKQMMMDEISSKGPELVCSIEVRNRIDSIYNKLKSKSIKLQFILDKSNEKLKKLQEQLLKIGEIILIIEGIFEFLNALVPVLNVIVQVAKVGINFLKGPAADGATTVRLKDQIDKSKAKVEEIKNSIKVFKKKVDKITKKALIPMGIVTLALGVITIIKTTITAVISLIESFYLKYILMCDVEGDSMEDEDYADAINDAPDKADITLIEDDLLPGTIERIRNANFQVIRYRIA